MTLLGFDFGTKKIGIAVGQTLTGQGAPLTTLRMVQQRPDWSAIERLLDEWQPEALVVGLPLTLDDKPTDVTERAKRFGRQLHGRYRLPVHMADECLTTRIAESEFATAVNKSGGLDAFAAKLIIETWISAQDD